MISIRRFADRSTAAQDDVAFNADAMRLRELLSHAAESRRPLQCDLGAPDFRQASRGLLERLEQASTAADLVTIAVDGVSSAEDYIHRVTESSEDHAAQVQSMIAMLTQAIADLAGQPEASVERLASVERDIEKAGGAEDVRKLKDNLGECLAAVKDAAAQERKEMQSTIERLQEEVKRPQAPAAPESAPANGASAGQPGGYLAAFKVQHADRILQRFGEAARDEMISIVGKGLESAQGSGDRLVRWNGASFVMFVSAADGIANVRRRVAAAAARISQRYIELGKNSALLAVSLDWTVFAQSQFPTLDGAFEAVDAFLK